MVLNLLSNFSTWRREEDSKLEKLKHFFPQMMNNPKNMMQNPELPLNVQIDASKRAFGASLVQGTTAEGGSCGEKMAVQ
jgi:hypothetical protein